MKKILILILCMFILVGTTSALDFDLDNYKKFDKDNSKYGKIEHWDKGQIGSDTKLAEYKLLKNTDQCLINCEAEGTLKLYEKARLFDDLKLKNKNGHDTTIKSLKIFIKVNISYNVEVPYYEEICEDVDNNGTINNYCERKQAGTNTETRTRKEWQEYDNKKLEPGFYEWKIVGKKNIEQSVDWRATAFGSEMSEWAWWDTDFNRRQLVAIQGGEELLVNFTILANITHDSDMKIDFTDIRFINGSCSGVQTEELKFEFDKVINSNAALVWIKIPGLSSGTNNICMYYDNAIASSGEDPENTWDDDYLGVWHFTEVTGNVSNSKDLSFANATEVIAPNPIIALNSSFGYSRQLDGGNYFNISVSNHFTPNNSMTLEMFSTLDVTPGGTDITGITRQLVPNDFTYYLGYFETGNKYSMMVSSDGTSTNRDVLNSNFGYTTGVRDYLVMTWNGSAGGIKFYKNKSLDSVNATIEGNGANGMFQSRVPTIFGLQDNFQGQITYDEIRISNITRSSAWINRTNDNINFSLVAFGGEELTAQVITGLITPLNVSNFSSSNITFTINSTPISTDLANITLLIWFSNGSLFHENFTSLSGNDSIITILNIQNFVTGNFIWNALTKGLNNTEDLDVNRTFSIDLSIPVLNVSSPTGLFNFHIVGDNLSLNWSVSDANLGTCWFEYNLTNTSVNCLANNYSFSTTLEKNLTFYANDTIGNLARNFTSWDYNVLEINQFFSNLTIEGATENFKINILIKDSLQLAIANLIYNGSLTSSLFSNLGEGFYLVDTNLVIPDVPSQINLSFFWNFLLSDSSEVNTSLKNQTINSLNLDDCSSFSNEILNFTIVDEKEQTLLPNATTESTITFSSFDGAIPLGNFSLNSSANPLKFCINQNLTVSTSYSIDAIIKYEALGYAIEYYNIVNSIISFDNSFQNIFLFDLNSSQSTDFRIIFKDSSFQLIENALVNINRQYVSENTFKTVELPKTDSNGETLGHFVRNDINYNILVIKNNSVIGNFQNIRVFCDDFTIGKCVLDLEASLSLEIDYDYNSELGLIFSSVPTYNNNTNLVSFTYATTTGEAKEVIMTVERNDVFGNKTLCNSVLTSASGTLSCVAGVTNSDSLVITKIFVDGFEIINTKQEVNQTSLGSFGYLMWFFLSLILIFGLGDNKEGVFIAMLLSYIGAISLGLADRSLFGISATGIWIIAITILGINKINSET